MKKENVSKVKSFNTQPQAKVKLEESELNSVSAGCADAVPAFSAGKLFKEMVAKK